MFKEMIMPLMSNSNLLVSMWSETFKRIMYNVNKISTNSVQKTSYEL